MSYAICPLSVIPVRSSATDKSEMLTQLLFGECAEILGNKGKSWLKIRSLIDNTIGWAQANQLRVITATEQAVYHNFFAFSLEYIHPIMHADHSQPISIGARLPDFDGLKCKLAEDVFNFSGQAIFPKDINPSADLVIKFARRYLYAPYLAGGRSPLGIDAPALVQLVYSFLGITLPRYADEQVNKGRTVDFVQQAQPGDVAFFENKIGNVNHTGILLPDRYILHAHGRVRIDKIDHYGIYNEEKKKYTHRLRIVRRFLADSEVKTITTEEQTIIPENQIGLF